MLKQVGTSDVGSGDGGGNNRGRVCDTCGFAACTVFSRADSAYLCAGCDAQLHAANRVASPHELVRVCEACERAPAAFLCKADASSLCTTCDAEIHSTNPLARRHQRVPILPISGRLYGLSAFNQGGPKLASTGETEEDEDETIAEEDEDEAASWLPLNPGKNSGNNQNNGFLLGGEEVDEYLDLEEYNSSTVENQLTDQYNQKQQHYGVQNKGYGGDSIGPVQSGEAKDHLQQQQHQSFQYGLDYDSSKSEYSYNGSVSRSVSLSSVDVGVAPESTVSDISAAQTRPPKGTIDIFCGAANAIRMPLPPQLKAMDREARVLRYREEKKTRKFEKTIRYVSRKAYAETRPRIKGRFAKRTDVEVEADRCSRQH